MKRHNRDELFLKVARLAVCGTGLMMMVLLMTACSVTAPSSAKVARVVAFSQPNQPDLQSQIRDELRKAGWIEAQNLVLEFHFTAGSAGDEELLPALETEAANGRPVVLLSGSTEHALALKQATSTLPIVVSIGDPIAIGLVSNFPHPGGNITGVSTNPFSQFGKRIEILRELFPNVRRLGVLYAEPTNPNLAPQLAEFEDASKQLGLQLLPIQARRPEEFGAAFEVLDRSRVDVLSIVQDGVTFENEAELAALATQHGIATLCARSDWVRRGCLMSYGSNTSALNALAINYVDRILRGARPGDLPIQLPTVFDLSINVKTLQALGLTIEPAALPLVTEWIQ